VIEEKDLETALKNTEKGGVATVDYTQQQVIDFLAKAKK
jgi:hypothetical protein